MDKSSFATRFADALVQLTPHRPDAIDDLRAFYANDMTFRDPIQEIHGLDDFLSMNRRLMGRMKSVEWTIRTTKGDDADVFLEWTMKGSTKVGLKLHVDGITRARLHAERIVHHRDYWDLAELVASSLPGGQRILHALLWPFA